MAAPATRASRPAEHGTWTTPSSSGSSSCVSEELNFVDLVWHELEFREGASFAYAVYVADGAYLGCCYLYPMGRRTQLSEELLAYDVDASWWVTPDAYERGYYQKLYRALRHWVAEDFPFEAPYYSNLEIPRE